MKKNHLMEPIAWENTDNPEFPFQAVVNGQAWVLRINDFPEEDLFTLMIDDVEVLSFNDWPPAWKRP